MSTFRLSALTAVLLLCSGVAANADDSDQYGPDITLGEAKTIAAGALKECEANKWYMAVAVVDTHGALVYYEKMDNTYALLRAARNIADHATSAAIADENGVDGKALLAATHLKLSANGSASFPFRFINVSLQGGP